MPSLTYDEFQPIDYAERLAEDIVDSELVGIEGAKHWMPVDRPEEYADRLAAFLLDGYDVFAVGS